jgi:hypothetical protein
VLPGRSQIVLHFRYVPMLCCCVMRLFVEIFRPVGTVLPLVLLYIDAYRYWLAGRLLWTSFAFNIQSIGSWFSPEIPTYHCETSDWIIATSLVIHLLSKSAPGCKRLGSILEYKQLKSMSIQ